MSDDEQENDERVVAVQTMMYSTRTMQEGDEGAGTRQLEMATTLRVLSGCLALGVLASLLCLAAAATSGTANFY